VVVPGFVAAAAGWLLGRGRGWYWALLCPAAALACWRGAPGLPALWALLAYAAARDLRDMEVPDLVWWLGAGSWLLLGGQVPPEAGIAGGYFALAFGLLLQWLSWRLLGNAGYGDADVLCGVLAGLYLGPLGACVSVGAGAVAGVAHGSWLRARRGLGAREPFPFLPALCLGVAVGTLISQLYMETFWGV